MKFIKIILFLLLINITGFSQKNRFESEHYLGAKFGVNMHFIVNDGTLIPGPYNFGLNYGLVYKYFAEQNAGLSLGLNYVQKGGFGYFIADEDPETVDTSVVIFRHRLEYLEFPILMNLRFGKKHSRFNLYLGPGLSYLYKQKIFFLDDTYGKTYKTGTDHKFEFAINAGGGYSFHFSKGELELNIMYTHGLTNVFKPQTVNNTLYNQTQMFAASLNYYFKI